MNDGVVLHAPSTLVAAKRIIEVYPSRQDDSGGRTRNETCLDGTNCVTEHDRVLFVAMSETGPVFQVASLKSCRHVTRLRPEAILPTDLLIASSTHLSERDLLSMAVNSVAEDGSFSMGSIREQFQALLYAALQLRPDGPTRDSQKGVSPLASAARRRSMADLEAFAIASNIGEGQLSLLRNEVSRADAELQISLSIQMHDLQEASAALERTAAKATLVEAERERRWSRIGAATVFPLLLLSLLGANTLPPEIRGFSTQSTCALIITVVLTLIAAMLGLAWADRKSSER